MKLTELLARRSFRSEAYAQNGVQDGADRLESLTGVTAGASPQDIDTSTPSGRMLFQMPGVFAEFERSIITARIKAGLGRARAQGKHFGRPNQRSTSNSSRHAERSMDVRRRFSPHTLDVIQRSPS